MSPLARSLSMRLDQFPSPVRIGIRKGWDRELGVVQPQIEAGTRGGKPCIRGMRITVYDVHEYLLGSGLESRQ